ncbi:MAG: hypothetical protein U0031_16465 [Thermomicrobiales bacterium]
MTELQNPPSDARPPRLAKDPAARAADRDARNQERLEREARGRRTLFVTSLAGFVAFFGLIVGGNPAVQHAAAAPPLSAAVDPGSAPSKGNLGAAGEDRSLADFAAFSDDETLGSPIQAIAAPAQPRARHLRTRAS